MQQKQVEKSCDVPVMCVCLVRTSYVLDCVYVLGVVCVSGFSVVCLLCVGRRCGSLRELVFVGVCSRMRLCVSVCESVCMGVFFFF